MKAYTYNKDTGEFLYISETMLDPLETEKKGEEVWLLPANSTFVEPLEPKDGYAVIWTGEVWGYVEDHRKKIDAGGVVVEDSGTPYWMEGDAWDTQPRYMTTVGALPEGALTEKPEKPLEVIEAERLQQLKNERHKAVSEITVEVDEMVFDGDEKSQERMARTVTAAMNTGASMDDTTIWVLHDNTVANVTIRQLATALRMAGEKQTELWTIPYTE